MNKPECKLQQFFAHVLAAQNVDVQMKDGLPRVLALVDDDAVTVFDAREAGDLGKFRHTLSDESAFLFAHFGKIRKVRLGNAQHVHLRLRVNVAEREHIPVLIHLVRGDLPAEDLTEYTVFVQTHFDSPFVWFTGSTRSPSA